MSKPLDTNDAEIRSALHNKVLKRFHNQNKTRIIDELGVTHGTQRIDIAVINGQLHGYEIKSSRDDLSRLPAQIKSFSKCFERLTVVTAEVHLKKVMESVPDFVGVILVKRGSRGAIYFESIRKPRKNSDLDIISTAHFLWKSEAIELLCNAGIPHRNLPRVKLYKLLGSSLPKNQIIQSVKHYLIMRENWRPDQSQELGDAQRRLASM